MIVSHNSNHRGELTPHIAEKKAGGFRRKYEEPARGGKPLRIFRIH